MDPSSISLVINVDIDSPVDVTPQVPSLVEISVADAIQALNTGKTVEIFPDGSASYKLEQGKIYVSLDEETWLLSAITFQDFNRYRWGQRSRPLLTASELPGVVQKALSQIAKVQSSDKILVMYLG
jgi:hypothetical protein